MAAWRAPAPSDATSWGVITGSTVGMMQQSAPGRPDAPPSEPVSGGSGVGDGRRRRDDARFEVAVLLQSDGVALDDEVEPLLSRREPPVGALRSVDRQEGGV